MGNNVGNKNKRPLLLKQCNLTTEQGTSGNHGTNLSNLSLIRLKFLQLQFPFLLFYYMSPLESQYYQNHFLSSNLYDYTRAVCERVQGITNTQYTAWLKIKLSMNFAIQTRSQFLSIRSCQTVPILRHFCIDSNQIVYCLIITEIIKSSLYNDVLQSDTSIVDKSRYQELNLL